MGLMSDVEAEGVALAPISHVTVVVAIFMTDKVLIFEFYYFEASIFIYTLSPDSPLSQTPQLLQHK
jgi:hypothetical protein